MKSQTARRPEQQRSARSTKPRRYVKQTAHVEARRDGKPLIFGWGGHLSRTEKIRIQRRAVWATTIIFILAIVGVAVGAWINNTIIIPNLPITTVNGQNITQSDYRKLLALKTQLEINKLKGPHGLNAQSNDLQKQINTLQKTIATTNQQIDTLNKKIKALPAGNSPQRSDLQNQLTSTQKTLKDLQAQHDKLSKQYQDLTQTTIPLEEQNFTQSQYGTDSATWLQDDVLIRTWLAKQSNDVKTRVEPTTSDVNNAIKDFIRNFPKSSNYGDFKNKDHVSDADVQAMMALKLRRDNMQTYVASQITSPTYQVKARDITLSTQKDADSLLQQLKNGEDFAKLAKTKSLDTTTNTKGGDLGWLVKGQYTRDYGANVSAVIDNWIFDPARRADEISPVLKENGTFHIIQITAIDPARPVDAKTLNDLKNNALTAWLFSQKALPTVKVGSIDNTKMLDSSNMPPDLPQSAPAAPGGMPGGLPGGIPGGAPGGMPGGAPSGAPGGAPGQP